MTNKSIMIMVKRIWAGLCLATATLCTLACNNAVAVEESPVFDCTATVQTSSGRFRGQQNSSDTCQYLGMRYAQAPLGNLRFKPPVPAIDDGIERLADREGHFCVQQYAMDQFLKFSLKPIGHEDCLFVNVWRPAYRLPTEPLPVMVFIHGGAFTVGAGSWLWWRGSDLAREGVVVVTFNYRLGPFGFLAHPQLKTEEQTNSQLNGTFGNYGILDQVEALRWVQNSIAAFGGDPNRVTIFGESAGGMSVCTLMATPLAKGLFHRAIIESGGCNAVGSEGAGFAYGVSWAISAGCPSGSSQLACLRGLTLADIFSSSIVPIVGSDFQPHVDGVVLTTTPALALQTGKAHAVPLIAGANKDEVGVIKALPSVADYIDRDYNAMWQKVAEAFGPQEVTAMQSAYPQSDYANPLDLLATLISDYSLNCANRLAAKWHAPKAPTYHYQFAWDDAPLFVHFGAFHLMEIPFVFGEFASWGDLFGGKYTEAIQLSAQVQRYWTRFAATGNPNGGDDPLWRDFSSGDSMILDLPSHAKNNYMQLRCDYWETNPLIGLDSLLDNNVFE